MRCTIAADFTCQEGAVSLGIAVELASPIGEAGRSLGQPKASIVPTQLPADSVLIRLPIPLGIRGAIPSLASGAGTSIGWLPIRAYEAVAISTNLDYSCSVRATIAGRQKGAARGATIRP